MSNIFKVNNKDNRMTSGASTVNFKHILHFIIIVVEFNQINVGRNNWEKYIVLWAGEICWATYFHSFSTSIRLQKD